MGLQEAHREDHSSRNSIVTLSSFSNGSNVIEVSFNARSVVSRHVRENGKDSRKK
jgi:hypothetical protein